MGNRKQKRKTKPSKQHNEDKVLKMAILAVIVLFITGFIAVGIKMLNPRPDTTEGMDRLEAMSKINVEETQKEIDAIDEAVAQADEERAKRPNSEKFQDTLILGDFIAQGAFEQGVLDESFVLATNVSCVHDMDGTDVTKYIEEAAAAKPKVLFIELGINDTIAEGGSADLYESEFRAFLEKVKNQLPDTTLFINSILPVQQKAIDENPGYANVDEYNQRLKKICKEEKITFIDSTGLVKDEYYKGDGKHMAKDYFTLWIALLADVAQL